MANPHGFRPARHMNGSNCFRADKFKVDSGGGKPIFQGHAVILSSGRVVEHSATGVGPILGVVKACYAANDKNRPLTHNLPNSGNFIAASASGFVDVYVDPDIIFEVVADSAVTPDLIGQLGDITATGSGNPSTGISRMQMDASTFAAQTSANSQTLPFRVIGVAKRNLAGETDAVGVSAAPPVEVIVNNHVYRQVTPV